ncbi:hypothetical protein FOCC_FOCC000902, partial [Frankliniella occidentalis]
MLCRGGSERQPNKGHSVKSGRLIARAVGSPAAAPAGEPVQRRRRPCLTARSSPLPSGMSPSGRAAAAGVAPEAVDRVLLQIGKLGPFQIVNCLAINMPILFSALYTIAYVFTAQELNYRCLIPECETADTASYAPPWLPEAIPVHDDTPEACVRFVHNNSSSSGDGGGNGTCSADLFDTTRTERCGAWVYEPGQRSTIL